MNSLIIIRFTILFSIVNVISLYPLTEKTPKQKVNHIVFHKGRFLKSSNILYKDVQAKKDTNGWFANRNNNETKDSNKNSNAVENETLNHNVTETVNKTIKPTVYLIKYPTNVQSIDKSVDQSVFVGKNQPKVKLDVLSAYLKENQRMYQPGDQQVQLYQNVDEHIYQQNDNSEANNADKVAAIIEAAGGNTAFEEAIRKATAGKFVVNKPVMDQYFVENGENKFILHSGASIIEKPTTVTPYTEHTTIDELITINAEACTGESSDCETDGNKTHISDLSVGETFFIKMLAGKSSAKKVVGAAREVEVTSRDVETTSRDIEATSRDIEATFMDIEATSKKTEAISRDTEASSRKTEPTSVKAEGASSEVTASSKEAETSTKEIESYSEETEDSSEQVKLTSKESKATFKAAQGSKKKSSNVDANSDITDLIDTKETEVTTNKNFTSGTYAVTNGSLEISQRSQK